MAEHLFSYLNKHLLQFYWYFYLRLITRDDCETCLKTQAWTLSPPNSLSQTNENFFIFDNPQQIAGLIEYRFATEIIKLLYIPYDIILRDPSQTLYQKLKATCVKVPLPG